MELDVRGEVCPYPMLEAVKAMRARDGEEILVVTDHAPCLETIPAQAPRFGYACTIEDAGPAEWHLTLTPSR